jgi:ATP-dependent DNA helicase RecQ
MLAALDEVFGFRRFRPNQREIVSAILARRDVFAVMPTGGGKSLCYQLPAYLSEGTCLVVSPLISLMKDQVDAAKANGLRAEFINSTLPGSERYRITDLLTTGELDLLYLAPERLLMEHFLPILQAAKLSLIAIDEAHCISEWGHDFRKDYLALDRLKPSFPNVPMAAFTATATHRVQQDTIQKLGLHDPFTIRASFDRPNLYYEVIDKHGVERQILDFVRSRPTESGIVYRTTRKDVESTAGFLQEKGVKALPYHAGLDNEVRRECQEMFNRDEINVVVATIAFGMGIDKSNVRYVIHGDLPKNIEGYYQETGRSGRDGDPAHCLLIFGYGDVSKLRYFVNKVEDPQQAKIQGRKLQLMADYATTRLCRRVQVLRYFGETYRADNCGACDVCVPGARKVDLTREAQIIMSAIVRTDERQRMDHVIDIVMGNLTDKVTQLGHNVIKTFGAGKDRDAAAWRQIITDLLARGCLVSGTGVLPVGPPVADVPSARPGVRTDASAAAGDEPVLMLTPKGKDVLFGRRRFTIIKSLGSDTAPDTLAQAPEERAAATTTHKHVAADTQTAASWDEDDYDADLFEELRALRKQLAKQKGMPPFVIFSDRTLHEMAREMPSTLAQMREITGVGKQKLSEYGFGFINLIGQYLHRHPSRRPANPPIARKKDLATKAQRTQRKTSE